VRLVCKGKGARQFDDVVGVILEMLQKARKPGLCKIVKSPFHAFRDKVSPYNDSEGSVKSWARDQRF
jgi:hypothetical protein